MTPRADGERGRGLTPAWHVAAMIAAALLLAGSGLYLALGSDKGLGVLLVIVSVILGRIVVIDLAGPRKDGRPPA